MGRFRSFFQGGFECATHRNVHRERLDVAAASRHDEFLVSDFRRLREMGIATVREGARWHLIEQKPGLRDFSSVERIFDAAAETGTEIVLDLMHFGWPDFLDIFSPGFVHAFESFALSAARFLKRHGVEEPKIIAVNEMSFLAWAGGDQALINPHQHGRGNALKRQLVKAAIAASKVLKSEIPSTRLITAEPVIHIVPRSGIAGDEVVAERHRLGMYEATDMLTGRICPELGGTRDLVDIFGVNFYDRNQWVNQSHALTPDHPRYRPFHRILIEVWERYRKPVFVSETGTEDNARAAWFEYVSSETCTAIQQGVPVEGICLYPVVNHPGWDDGRHCCNGLWDYANDFGQREMYQPLADALAREQARYHREFSIAA